MNMMIKLLLFIFKGTIWIISSIGQMICSIVLLITVAVPEKYDKATKEGRENITNK